MSPISPYVKGTLYLFRDILQLCVRRTNCLGYGWQYVEKHNS